jgi:proteic killer suppression protein
MIKSFQHKGVKAFFETGSMVGIQAGHAVRLAAILARLNQASNSHAMNLPGWKLHKLKGRDLKEHFSVSVSGNWRVTFKFDGADVVLVDYLDYH